MQNPVIREGHSSIAFQSTHLLTTFNEKLDNVRADRLITVLLILQARGRITAAELAAELEVSLATARRDLEALSIAGVPIYSQAGRGGGWSLIGGARTDLSGLTLDEVRALFLLVGPITGWPPEAKRALRKLVQALPQPFRADADSATNSAVVDRSAWGRSRPTASTHLAVVQTALIDGVQVDVEYTDRSGHETKRRVHPLGLVEKNSAWYLVADTDRGRRTFVLDRIRTAVPRAEKSDTPDDFDLATTWDEVVDAVEQLRVGATARIRVDVGLMPMLAINFGRTVRVLATVNEDMIDVEVGCASLDKIAENLAGFGRGVEVLGPTELRSRLAEIGRELISRHRLNRAHHQTESTPSTSRGHNRTHPSSNSSRNQHRENPMTNTETTVATSPAHLMELFAERAAVGDVDAVMDLYETGAVFEPQFGVALAGHDQIRPAIAEFLTLKPQITFTGEPNIVVTGDIALVSNVWAMSAAAPDGSSVADGGTSADVVRRQTDGSWKILIDQPRGSAGT